MRRPGDSLRVRGPSQRATVVTAVHLLSPGWLRTKVCGTGRLLRSPWGFVRMACRAGAGKRAFWNRSIRKPSGRGEG
jgi:hypothetical protein